MQSQGPDVGVASPLQHLLPDLGLHMEPTQASGIFRLPIPQGMIRGAWSQAVPPSEQLRAGAHGLMVPSASSALAREPATAHRPLAQSPRRSVLVSRCPGNAAHAGRAGAAQEGRTRVDTARTVPLCDYGVCVTAVPTVMADCHRGPRN